MRPRARQLLVWAVLLATCCWVAPADAANFTAGQNASMQLGGPSWTSVRNGSRGDRSLYNPTGVTSDGTRIYAADSGMNRIAQWNAFPVANGPVIDALQQKTVGANTMFDPTGVCTRAGSRASGDVVIGGGHMAVADTNHDRVLLWNTVPTVANTPPDVVLGQSSFTSCPAPTALTVSASTLWNPDGVWISANKVVVADTTSNRVLVWNSWPAANGAPADLVLGQPDMTSVTAGSGATGFDTPTGVYGDPAVTKLLVSDMGNNRVVGFSTFPAASSVAADRVFGQADVTSGVNASCGQSRLSAPADVWTDGTKVAIADAGNNRVMFWNAWPGTTAGTAANGEVGHSLWTTCTANDNLSTLTGAVFRSPQDVWSDGTRVLVSDWFDNRVLTYGAWPSGTTNTAASFVLGHDTMAKAGVADANRDLTFVHRRYTLDEHGIWPLAIPGGGLLVESADTSTGMLWSTTPAATNTMYTWRLHQGDDTHTFPKGPTNTRSAFVADDPQGSWSDGTRLMVADQDHDRVLIYNTLPTADNPSPNAVLGQTSFTSNQTGVSQSLIEDPHSVASDGTRVAITDQNNNRVLIWNSIPTTTPSPPADVVLGQPDFTTKTANTGGRSAATMSGPVGIAIWNGKLLVADKNNNRILVWNSIPTTSAVPADAIIGQSSATSAANGTDAQDPVGLSATANAVFFTNDCGARVLDPIPTSGFVSNASVSIGTSTCATDDTWSQDRDAQSSGISALSGSVWIGQDAGARVVRWVDGTAPTITVAPTATVRCDGTVTISFTTSESTVSTAYYDTVTRGGVYTSYASNVAESTYTGLTHAIDLSFATPGMKYAMVRAVDWNSQAVTSAEISFTVPATCPAPTTMLADDANAQAGFGRANPSTTNTPPINSLSFHTSWLQSSGVTMDSVQSETWSTPPEHAGGLWHLDGSTAADANSQSTNAITWAGAPGYTGTGKFGQGTTFDGSSQSGAIASDPLLAKANDFTVDLWFRTSTIANSAFPIMFIKSGSDCGPANRCNYSLEWDRGANQLCASLSNTSNSEIQACRTATGLLDGQWHYAAMTVTSANQLNLYVDGALAAGPVAMGAPAKTGPDPIGIGHGNANDNNFQGDLDELRFAPVAYGATAIAGYYKTQRPHADRVWNSTPTALGANCTTAARCTDQVYAGSTGILHDGARYWQRTRFNTLNNDYWSTYGLDWFEVSNTTSISLSAGGTVALGTTLPGTDVFGTSNIDVTTNSANGYQLFARDEDDTWGLERLGGGPTIVDRQNGAIAPATWAAGAAGFFGVTVRDAPGGRLAKWGAGTGWPQSDTTNNLYTGLEGTSDVLLHQRTTYSSPADTIVFTVRANPGLAQAAGAYDGVVTLTAIANP